MGGMGGFFPPLLLGVFRDKLGIVWPGFLLLSAVACLLWWANARVFLPRENELQAKLPAAAIRTADTIRSGAWATLWTGVLIAAIVLGSRNLQNFDPALVIYTFAIIFATWGVVFHYSVWIRKPPTRVYWQRGWQLFRERGVFRSLAHIVSLVGTHLLSQTFIARRSRLRWAMSLIAVLLIVQIWLLSAALESFLAGKHHTALPAAIFSGLMFLVCFGLYLFVDRVDAEVRHSDEDRQR